MADRKFSRNEWLAKADYEGGIIDAVQGYGLDHTDLQREDDPEFYDAVKELVEGLNALKPVIRRLEGYEIDYESLDD